MCKFENILKMPKFGKLCNDSRIIENAYKVFVFENILEKRVYVWEIVLFVSKRLRAIYLLKSSLFFSSFPLDSAILPLVSR